MTQQALSRQDGGFKKIILIGANGKIGELVQKALAGAGHEIVRSGTNLAIFKSRSRTAKVSGSFIKPSARLMPWPLQQAKSHLLRFRNSPLKNGSPRWEASSWVRSAWFRRRSRSSKKMDPSLWFRAFLMTNRSSPVSQLQPSRAHWKVLFGLPQSNFPRDCVSIW